MIKDHKLILLEDYIYKLADIIIKMQTEAYTSSLTKKIKDHDKVLDQLKTLIKFQVSNKVMFFYNQGNGRTTKLATLCNRPMTVTKKINPDSYTLKDDKSNMVVNRVHAKYMKRFLC